MLGYKIKGRRREINLGSAKLISLAKVFKKAFNNLFLVSKSTDPIEEKRQSSVVPSFEDPGTLKLTKVFLDLQIQLIAHNKGPLIQGILLSKTVQRVAALISNYTAFQRA